MLSTNYVFTNHELYIYIYNSKKFIEENYLYQIAIFETLIVWKQMIDIE